MKKIPNESAPQTNSNEVPASDLKMPEAKPQSNNASSSSLGTILGIVIVILLLVIAGLYVWGSNLSATPEAAPAERSANDGTSNANPEASVDASLNQ